MDLDEALDVAQFSGGQVVRPGEDLATAIETLLAAARRLDAIERRAVQVEGGHYMPYARPDEVARWIRTGNREPAASPKAP